MADEVIVIHGGNWNALARAHGHSSAKGSRAGAAASRHCCQARGLEVASVLHEPIDVVAVRCRRRAILSPPARLPQMIGTRKRGVPRSPLDRDRRAATRCGTPPMDRSAGGTGAIPARRPYRLGASPVAAHARRCDRARSRTRTTSSRLARRARYRRACLPEEHLEAGLLVGHAIFDVGRADRVDRSTIVNLHATERLFATGSPHFGSPCGASSHGVAAGWTARAPRSSDHYQTWADASSLTLTRLRINMPPPLFRLEPIGTFRIPGAPLNRDVATVACLPDASVDQRMGNGRNPPR